MSFGEGNLRTAVADLTRERDYWKNQATCMYFDVVDQHADPLEYPPAGETPSVTVKTAKAAMDERISNLEAERGAIAEAVGYDLHGKAELSDYVRARIDELRIANDHAANLVDHNVQLRLLVHDMLVRLNADGCGECPLMSACMHAGELGVTYGYGEQMRHATEGEHAAKRELREPLSEPCGNGAPFESGKRLNFDELIAGLRKHVEVLERLIIDMHADIISDATLVSPDGTEKLAPWCEASIGDFEARMRRCGIEVNR